MYTHHYMPFVAYPPPTRTLPSCCWNYPTSRLSFRTNSLPWWAVHRSRGAVRATPLPWHWPALRSSSPTIRPSSSTKTLRARSSRGSHDAFLATFSLRNSFYKSQNWIPLPVVTINEINWVVMINLYLNQFFYLIILNNLFLLSSPPSIAFTSFLIITLSPYELPYLPVFLNLFQPYSLPQ